MYTSRILREVFCIHAVNVRSEMSHVPTPLASHANVLRGSSRVPTPLVQWVGQERVTNHQERLRGRLPPPKPCGARERETSKMPSGDVLTNWQPWVTQQWKSACIWYRRYEVFRVLNSVKLDDEVSRINVLGRLTLKWVWNELLTG